MASTAYDQFSSLVGSIDQLIAIHGKLQKGKGRRHEQDAIHRAGVVMMVAAWESYVEKVTIAALDAMADDAGVGGSGSPVPIWAKHAFALRRADITKSVKRFNTPDAKNVRDLLKDAFEFDPWASWYWNSPKRKWDEKKMRTRLDEWILVRHSVAHGFKLPHDVQWLKGSNGKPRLTLSMLLECKRFFEHVVDQTDKAFGDHLKVNHGLVTAW